MANCLQIASYGTSILTSSLLIPGSGGSRRGGGELVDKVSLQYTVGPQTFFFFLYLSTVRMNSPENTLTHSTWLLSSIIRTVMSQYTEFSIQTNGQVCNNQQHVPLIEGKKKKFSCKHIPSTSTKFKLKCTVSSEVMREGQFF